MPDSRLAGRRILVVEDEVMISMLIEDMLDELGCVVAAVAARQATALEFLVSERIDAAILDLNLNGDTSFGVAAALAAREIPFLFSTGYGDATLLPEYVGRPIMTKPFRLADLQKHLLALFAD